MSTSNKTTHPMVIIAAGAVTLLCFAGIASIMGWLPPAGSSGSKAGASLTAAPAATPPAPTPAAKPEPKQEEVKVAAAEPAPVLKPEPKPTPQPAAKPAAKPLSAARPLEPAPMAQVPAPTPTYVANAGSANPPVATPRPVCRNCGVVASVNTIEKKGEGSGAGAVIGGIVGGVLGHQVGGGRGKDVATVAGAVGGALAGNEIEKANKKSLTWEVRIEMQDGTYRNIRSETDPRVRAGDRVRIEDGRVVRERG